MADEREEKRRRAYDELKSSAGKYVEINIETGRSPSPNELALYAGDAGEKGTSNHGFFILSKGEHPDGRVFFNGYEHVLENILYQDGAFTLCNGRAAPSEIKCNEEMLERLVNIWDNRDTYHK